MHISDHVNEKKTKKKLTAIYTVRLVGGRAQFRQCEILIIFTLNFMTAL